MSAIPESRSLATPNRGVCTVPITSRRNHRHNYLRISPLPGSLPSMQYIRFFKSPRFTYARNGHPGKVWAIITITSDLGESFFARDVDLTARLLDDTASRRPLPIPASRYRWRSHMTQLRIELDVTIQPEGALHRRVTLAVSSDQTAADNLSRPIGCNSEILSAYSSPFELTSGAVAESFVQRVLEIGCGEVLPIWEAMGESICRHIWYRNSKPN